MDFVKKTITIEGVEVERYVAPYEGAYTRHIDPLFFLAGGGVHDPTYALHALQKSFHVLLRKYLKISERDFDIVARREIASCRFFSKCIDPSHPMVKALDVELAPAAFVCATYAVLRALHPAVGNAPTHTKKFDIPYDLKNAEPYPSRQNRLLRTLSDWVHTRLADSISLFIVHGSYATGDFVEGSDLDTAVVLKEEVLLNPGRLERMRNNLSSAGLFCYLFDPLAHHELMVFTQFDIEYYLEDTLPISAYENGLLLFGKRHLEVLVRDSADEQLHRLAWYASWYRGMVEGRRWADNVVDWKNVAGVALLLPSLALQSRGEYVYKRESFEMARLRFPDAPWGCVDVASEIRRRWRVRSWVQRMPAGMLLRTDYDLARRILMRLLRRTHQQKPLESVEDIEMHTKQSLTLMEHLLQSALKTK